MSVDPEDLSSVSFELRRDGELSFTLQLDRSGLVKRMGSSKAHRPDGGVALGEEPGLFEQLVAAVPDGLLSRGGSYDAGTGDGVRMTWRIEFHGRSEPVTGCRRRSRSW
jgi:hypothetical protein